MRALRCWQLLSFWLKPRAASQLRARYVRQPDGCGWADRLPRVRARIQLRGWRCAAYRLQPWSLRQRQTKH